MALRRPRRIFRSGSNASRARGGLSTPMVAGLLGAVGCAMVMVVSLPSALFGRVPVLSGTLNADAPDVAVVDGGTLRLRDTVVRLDGIDAPARGQTCQGSGGGYDCGAAAAQALATMVRGHSVICHLAGRDGAGFAEARCEAAGAQLNRALIAGGFARARATAADLADAQDSARSQKRGLWQAGGDAPSF